MFHVEHYLERGTNERNESKVMSNGRKQDERSLYTETVRADRKQVTVDLRENGRGRFVRVTEDVNGRRDSICVPVEGIRSLIGALQQAEIANAR